MVSHQILLTSEQRNILSSGGEITVPGVSVPVWVHRNKTSEPAEEVFVKYKIWGEDGAPRIKHNKEGYDIHMPVKSALDKDGDPQPNLGDLKDVKNNGCEWVAFKQSSKAQLKQGKTLKIIHFVQIKDISELQED